MISEHPSAILRADEADRHARYNLLVSDLRLAAAAVLGDR